MEPNPIFLLECHQAKRNGLFWMLLVIGLAEGFSRMCMLEAANAWGPDMALIMLILLVSATFYFVQFALPFYFAWRIATQRLNDDLILATAMSPFEIFWGKVQFGILCGGILYGPTIPGTLLLASLQSGIWLAVGVSGFLLLEYAIIVGLGFMSGAKTLDKMMTLMFLLGLFGIAVVSISSVVVGNLRFWAGWDYIGVALFFFSHFLGIVSAALLFVVGVASLQSNLDTRKKIAYCLTVSFFVCFGFGFLFSFGSDGFRYLIPTVVLSILYFGPPLGAICLQGIFLPGEFEDSPTTAGMEAYPPS